MKKKYVVTFKLIEVKADERCAKKPSNCYVPANQWRREIEKDYNDPFHNCLPESYLLFPELALQ